MMSTIIRDMEARRPGVLEDGGLPEKAGVDAWSLVPDPSRGVQNLPGFQYSALSMCTITIVAYILECILPKYP